MKKHHDHCNSYTGKCLIGPELQFRRFSPLSLWQGAWQHVGSRDAGEGNESSTS